jgi:hypothetical protein
MKNKRIPVVTLLAIVTLFSFKTSAQSSASTLEVVSWNVEWFGANFDGPADDNLQEVNVKKVLRYLNADLYGLVEVVDTAHFRKVVDSLGINWGYVLLLSAATIQPAQVMDGCRDKNWHLFTIKIFSPMYMRAACCAVVLVLIPTGPPAAFLL